MQHARPLELGYTLLLYSPNSKEYCSSPRVLSKQSASISTWVLIGPYVSAVQQAVSAQIGSSTTMLRVFLPLLLVAALLAITPEVAADVCRTREDCVNKPWSETTTELTDPVSRNRRQCSSLSVLFLSTCTCSVYYICSRSSDVHPCTPSLVDNLDHLNKQLHSLLIAIFLHLSSGIAVLTFGLRDRVTRRLLCLVPRTSLF